MAGQKILIFEDEFIPASDLKKQLTKFGYEILAMFTKADQGLAYLEKHLGSEKFPDAVIMDITLKGSIDGIEAVKLITERYHCGVVFLTGLSQLELIQEAFRIKPFPYLIKPFDIRQVHVGLQLAIHQNKLEMKIKSLLDQLKIQSK